MRFRGAHSAALAIRHLQIGLLLAALASADAGAVAPTGARPADELSERHQRFLQEASAFLTTVERQVFEQLTTDYRRDEFIRRFWRTRDPFPETPRNELREQLELNLQVARDRYGNDLGDARARFVVLHGAPWRTIPTSCDKLRPLEIWHYRASPIVPQEFYAVFVRQAGAYRLWAPSEGVASLALFTRARGEAELVREIERGCNRGDDIVTAFALSPDWQRLSDTLLERNDEWARAFLARSTEVPADAEASALGVVFRFPGRHQSRTVVQAQLRLRLADLASVETAESERVSVTVDGDVLRGERLFESFRYRFDLPVDDDTDPAAPLPILIERYLRPGAYRVAFKVRDVASDRLFHVEEPLEVPAVAAHAPAKPAAATPLADRAQEQPPAPRATSPERAAPPEPAVLRLRSPGDDLLVGKVRIGALARGDGIARVGFGLDGREVISKRKPPYEVELDLGRTPRRHLVQATAFDADGAVLARDQLELNTGPHRFSIRLIEPQRGGTYSHQVRASAEVTVPRLERLDRVEFYLNDTLIATLYQPPFVQPIAIPDGLALSYVRTVGYLENGTSAEDQVFVNAPGEVEYLDVNMVELYTTVTDRRGRPIEGLGIDDFVVVEDGQQQTISRFELVKDLPVHAGVLLDLSTSMDRRLDEARDAALHFFEKVITQRDRACLMTFNDHYELVVGFTNRREVLAAGLAGLVAEGETALYDSLIQALFYFHGLEGKRALVLLTDGEDSTSRYRWDDALEFARQSRVSIYSIGIDIDHRDIDVRSRLNQLCKETGGRCFFVATTSELPRVYSLIEQELRAQYLIAYQSTNGGDRSAFREVDLRVAGRGLRARTIRGYYP